MCKFLIANNTRIPHSDVFCYKVVACKDDSFPLFEHIPFS